MPSPFDSLTSFANQKLAALEALHRRRHLVLSERGANMRIGNLISFTDNDYLGLSTDRRVIEAACAATESYGAGAGASRLITGNHPLYTALEEKLATLKGAEAAIVFGSGFMTNCGTIPALVGPQDVIFADALIHASLHAGIKLSGAAAYFFDHNDTSDLKRLLTTYRATGNRALLLVDGVYSMDGDQAPIQELASLAEAYDTWLMVDDAHGFGTLGGGKGTVAQAGETDRVPLMMGTLSKAVGAYGGYLAAPAPVIELMKSRARSLVYTTGLPPGVIAAALMALEIIESEPDRCARPLLLARRFTDALGLSRAESAIVPLPVGDDQSALAADHALQNLGFKVAAIRPPTVPKGTARLRVSFSATHSDADVETLITAVKDLKLNDPARSEDKQAS